MGGRLTAQAETKEKWGVLPQGATSVSYLPTART
jgi:hypothetical protein